MASFGPFSRLPLELRQRIWQLSMEPRHVLMGKCEYLHAQSSPPAVLQACAESRSHLRGHYTQEARCDCSGSSASRAMVNYDIDTVCMTAFDITIWSSAKDAPIKYLALESRDSEAFFWNTSGAVRDIATLEHLEIHPTPGSWPERKKALLLQDWISQLEVWYTPCPPAPFRTKIISPWPDVDIPEVGADNFDEISRAWDRTMGWASDGSSEADEPFPDAPPHGQAEADTETGVQAL
ncbi:hypothetical protein GQ607_011760 [Colletotrichum asianum]|uniref:2EXR domain-containing protein n=1 Tax=Colletotrichum asianum TaxID=702518 RepID=A0A8H3WA75_9PEZI|nr:hypothetical protein GQ607_011760 [Colletotrichum asianum]